MRLVPILTVAALLTACGTVYVNKSDRPPKFVKETDFASSRSAETTYRRIFTMLNRCTSGYYRVQGNFDQKTSDAEISVDTGVGFENDLYFADNHVMTILVTPDGDRASKVRIKQTSRHGTPYVSAMADWVNEDSDDCAA